MSGKKRKDARPLCACGCGQKVNKFTAKYLPGHHRRGIKGEIAPFYGENNKERRGIKSKECMVML